MGINSNIWNLYDTSSYYFDSLYHELYRKWRDREWECEYNGDTSDSTWYACYLSHCISEKYWNLSILSDDPGS